MTGSQINILGVPDSAIEEQVKDYLLLPLPFCLRALASLLISTSNPFMSWHGEVKGRGPLCVPMLNDEKTAMAFRLE